MAVLNSAQTQCDVANTPACRCCGSPDVFRVGSKRGIKPEHVFNYYRCRSCNFLFVSPFLGAEVYNLDYYNGAGPDPWVDYATEYEKYQNTDRILEFRDLARIASHELGQTQQTANGPIRWLDFGCGAGGFLKFLRDQRRLRAGNAWRDILPAGHDVGEWANKLKADAGFTIYDFDELAALESGTFDVISMIEVLEHIPSPHETLALASHLLKPGGLLLLTTGNLSCPIAKRDGLDYRYCVSEIHISLYDPKCLALAYRQAGLSLVQVRYEGVVQFKAVKSLRGDVKKKLGRILIRIPGVTRLIDYLYGVSAMPCARKPIV